MYNCYNNGCGQRYDIEDNVPGCCNYHPGKPYFHDAYKAWTCCQKGCVDFTEFLKIKGCVAGIHSNVKPLFSEDTKQNQLTEVQAGVSVESSNFSSLRRPLGSVVRPSPNMPMILLVGSMSEQLRREVTSLENIEMGLQNVDISDIKEGSPCYNNGCGVVFYKEVQLDVCKYHPGSPIFHEGYKYWSCCPSHCTDFAQFMAQPGCTVGDHLWHKKMDAAAACRFDWYQTGEHVVLTVYAKKYLPRKTLISANAVRVHIKMYFPETDNYYEKLIDLYGIIDAEKSLVTYYPSKVEIILWKKTFSTWPKLEHEAQ